MSRRLECLLREWGAWWIRNMDFADEWGENALYRAGILWGRVQYGRSGHKILCPEQPRRLKDVDRAVTSLRDTNEAQMAPVILWYCAPLKPDGAPYSMREIAMLTADSVISSC